MKDYAICDFMHSTTHATNDTNNFCLKIENRHKLVNN